MCLEHQMLAWPGRHMVFLVAIYLVWAKHLQPIYQVKFSRIHSNGEPSSSYLNRTPCIIACQNLWNEVYMNWRDINEPYLHYVFDCCPQPAWCKAPSKLTDYGHAVWRTICPPHFLWWSLLRSGGLLMHLSYLMPYHSQTIWLHVSLICHIY